MQKCLRCGLALGIWSIKLNIDGGFSACCLDCEGEAGYPVYERDHPGKTFEEIAEIAIHNFVRKQVGGER